MQNIFGSHSEHFTRFFLSKTLSNIPVSTITLPHVDWDRPILEQTISKDNKSTNLVNDLKEKGFVVIEKLLQDGVAEHLNHRLEAVLNGEFDTGKPPGKRPSTKLSNPWKPGKRTIQVVNIRHADSKFYKVITSPILGKLVANLANWEHGARVASDQVWCKPPTSGALSFHRDSAYFDFIPADVVTVWIAFDDMIPEVGPLEYVEGSHKWGEGRVGSANQFFDNDRRRLMYDAAIREGFTNPKVQLNIHQVNVNVGGCGIHNGRTWHGSDRNYSHNKPRRGLGIHFVPANATFKEEGELGKMWSKFKSKNSNEMPEDEFPVTFRRK
jgi:phytanoyl-CoA hydroxylase